MTEHELLMDALRSAVGLSPEQALAARLIDERRSAEALPVLERIATHPVETAHDASPDPFEALENDGAVTLGVAAAALIATLARADGRSLTGVYDTLWHEIECAPRLVGRAADRLLLQVLLTRCYDARFAALPHEAAHPGVAAA